MNKGQYLAADSPEAFERERLKLLEQLGDPISVRHLQQLGVQEGWSCLEVGAGKGSIARWLSTQVGSKGKIVATDINPRFLSDISEPNLEIRQHDILKDPLEISAYDLAHCRTVLMHLPEPERALQNMAEAVKPGGWLLIEEADFISYSAIDKNQPAGELLNRASNVVLNALQSAGVMDPYFGRRVPGLIEQLGFLEVGHEGVTWVNRGGHAGAHCLQMNLQLVKSRGIPPEMLSESDFNELERLCLDPDFRFVDVTLFAGWGKRPV